MAGKSANFTEPHAAKISELAEQYDVTFNEMVRHLTILGQRVLASMPEIKNLESGDVALITFDEREIKFWKKPTKKWGGKRK